MKKKGFTLIELLAVIIILAVIALIATPIVLNVVENAKKQANKNSVYGIMDSAKLYYTESLLDSSKSSNINGVTNLIDEIKVSGKKPDSGVLYINDNGQTALALVYDNVCYKKNFTEKDLTESEDIENCSLNIEETPIVQEGCRVTEGSGSDIGDVITCGTESFYVYDTTGDNIKMLAMYNLEVGNSTNSSYPAAVETNKQSSKAIGNNFKGIDIYSTVKFSLNNSSYEGSIVKGYVDTYKTILEGMGVNVIDASLITYNELVSLGCNRSSATCTNSAYSWIYSTTYWTSSPDTSDYVWRIHDSNAFTHSSYSNDNGFGVRPVITISKSIVEGFIEPPKACSVTEGSGENIGDVITCGTESFYVYDTTGNNIKMLAMYNLEVGNSTNSSYPAAVETNKQSSNAIGYKSGINTYATVRFSSASKKGINYSSYSGSIVQGYVDTYKTILEGMGVNVIDATLITKLELEQLLNGGNSLSRGSIKTKADGLNMTWVYSTSYWSGSVYDANDVWYVNSAGSLNSTSYDNEFHFGVRPVITISKADL